jgi:hypothetical protein
VTELYEAHALGLIRLAHIMLGDRSSAEDVIGVLTGNRFTALPRAPPTNQIAW